MTCVRACARARARVCVCVCVCGAVRCGAVRCGGSGSGSGDYDWRDHCSRVCFEWPGSEDLFYGMQTMFYGRRLMCG